MNPTKRNDLNSIFMVALISNRWQYHALIWLGASVIHTVMADVSFFIFSRRMGSLRMASGYERWLQLAEEKFRQAQRWQM
ncbi:MAG: hypothetical protein QXI60_09160 [Thermofilaceae archaeon]